MSDPGSATRHSFDRLELHTVPRAEAERSFAEDVQTGLTATDKSLLPKYFYDELGSVLFEAITLVPEYYPTRVEAEILTRSASSILAEMGDRVRLAELGSGSSTKTRALIEAGIAHQGELHYTPIDISAAAIEASALQLLQLYPKLHISAYVADYSHGLHALLASPRGPTDRVLVLFLGSTIGNLDQAHARSMLRELRASLSPGDALLLGADLKKAPELLVAAYDDPTGVTAAFNRNILGRINRELGGHFDLRNFRHIAEWNEALGRMEMHLESTAEHTVRIDGLDLDVQFVQGERIHTECSHKYERSQLDAMARAAGFHLARTWLDAAAAFSVNLLRVD